MEVTHLDKRKGKKTKVSRALKAPVEATATPAIEVVSEKKQPK